MSRRPPASGAAQNARIRARLERRFALRDLPLALAGAPAPLMVTIPADPDAPLDQMAAEQAARRATQTRASSLEPPAEVVDSREPSDPLNAPDATHGHPGDGARAARVARATVASGAHLPYWALLWPSGMALAEALLAEPEVTRGKRTLELGCGLGVTATIALQLGARLSVCDLFDDALLFAEYNARRGAGRAPATLLLNWRTAEGRARLLDTAPFDLLLAADVLYESDDIEALLTLAPALLRSGAPFWLAEPGRKASRAFVDEALARGWHDRSTRIERAWPPDGDDATVTIHRLTLPDA